MSSRRGLGLNGDYMAKAFAKGQRTLERNQCKDKVSVDTRPHVQGNAPCGKEHKAAPPTKQTKAKRQDGFAGFGSGFLNKSKAMKKVPPTTKPAPEVDKAAGKAASGITTATASSLATPSPSSPSQSNQDESPRVPFIKAGGGGPLKAEDKLRFKEVEQAMQGPAASFMKDREKEWLTPALIDQVAKDPVLARMMTNPEFATVLAEFQADPKATLQKYDGKDGGKMGEFLRRFCGLMGTHFEGLGVKEEETATAAAQAKAREGERLSDHVRSTAIEKAEASRAGPKHSTTAMDEADFYAAVNDKQVAAVFQMPAVQQLFQLLHDNPAAAHGMLQTNRDPRFHRAVALLVNKGLFKMQPAAV